MTPFKDTPRGQTHYLGCWRDPAHHECAVKLIERANKIICAALGYPTQEKLKDIYDWLRDLGDGPQEKDMTP